jgi:hypothetical protein
VACANDVVTNGVFVPTVDLVVPFRVAHDVQHGTHTYVLVLLSAFAFEFLIKFFVSGVEGETVGYCEQGETGELPAIFREERKHSVQLHSHTRSCLSFLKVKVFARVRHHY